MDRFALIHKLKTVQKDLGDDDGGGGQKRSRIYEELLPTSREVDPETGEGPKERDKR